MPAKKTIKKNIISPVIKKPESEYKGVFPEIVIITPLKIDLNWISVRRKIQKFSFLVNVDKRTMKERYGFNLWEIYSNWFNNKFNKKIDISDEEDYKKFERQIRGLKDE